MKLNSSLLQLASCAVLLASDACASTLDKRILDPVCVQIAGAISSASDVYYLGHPNYSSDNNHWASSSSQVSKCSVQPGTAADVGIILGILGSTQTPFAVKGGGHASNQGFSSTTGIQISMKRFNQVTYDAGTQLVQFGSGLIWDDVYAALAPTGRNVVGGRVSGVGVAGFTLGGGYSWKTNQYGLTVDTVTAYELVKPDGTVATVTHASDPNLFFGLKGGFNNFGIVTKFTLKTFPQTQVWGGLITYTVDQISAVTAAAEAFSSTVTDPKASMISAINYISPLAILGPVGLGVSQLLFYDGPTPPPGIFDAFLSIPHFTKDVSTRSFLSLVQAAPANVASGSRGTFQSSPLLAYSSSVLNAIVNETLFWGTRLSLKTGILISYDVEPFLPSILSHNNGLASAYPASRSTAYLPLNLYFAWAPGSSIFDQDFQDAIRASAARITQVAKDEGQTGVDTAPIYPNYAISGTPLARIYGSNVAALQTLKQQVDPNNVMGLAGGWKV
ncbi:hypothetical protein HGRIS_005380 [Hohenbuehelia grisea]|uniref:FAD-binding PCMH-type domain-containing protein n=1 Tax=Hohenbuehelia grisea TaxID=104357 RepID=A0ABR3JF07_9AGAR